MVSKVCRDHGLRVETQVRRRVGDDDYVFDVLAWKGGSESEVIAFECAYLDRPAIGDDVLEFARKLQTFGIRHGVLVCSGGFSTDAEYHGRDVGIELWSLSMLGRRVQDSAEQERKTIGDVLPLDPVIVEHLVGSSITNFSQLKLLGVPKLELRPYHFFDFHTLAPNGVSDGVVVVDGVDGSVVDSVVNGGNARNAQGGAFVECRYVESRTGIAPELPENSKFSGSLTRAPMVYEPEAAGHLARTEIAKSLLGDASKVDMVLILSSKLLHIPIVSVQFRGIGGRTYERIVQGATGRTIYDETAFCEACGGISKAVCEVCGRIACSTHSKRCDRCLQFTCESPNCISLEGILSKSLVCARCRARK